MVFGFWGFDQLRRLHSGENPDCFWQFGAFQVCDAVQNLSIYSSFFMLMTQALVSRIFFPGISIFINSSVSVDFEKSLRRTLLTRRRFLMLPHPPLKPTVRLFPMTKTSLLVELQQVDYFMNLEPTIPSAPIANVTM